MFEIEADARGAEFQRNYLAWTTLHHFLPACLIRELAVATLAHASPPMVLSDLFDEALSPGPVVTASWALVPRLVSGPRLDFFQQHIRALGWSNDAELSPRATMADGEDGEAGPPHWISAALRLGRFDFGSRIFQIEQLGLPAGSSAQRIATALIRAIQSWNGDISSNWSDVHEELGELSHPLRALALKHFGDLCADADAWLQAVEFYRHAKASLVGFGPEWSDLALQLADIIDQSNASAAWTLRGPEAAASQFDQLTEIGEGRAARLAILNGSHDALSAALRARERRDWTDVRATVMYPPQLIQSFDTGSALESWLNGKHDNANRHFWSVLRRQTALGSVAEAKATKAAYGRALVSEVSGEGKQRVDSASFELGIRLLIESGVTDMAARADFSTQAVERYVNAKLVDDLWQRAERYEGAKAERTLVLFEVFSKWIAVLGADHTTLVHKMLDSIVERTLLYPADFDSSRNVGGRGLKLLIELAKARPAFRKLVAPKVATLIIEKTQQAGFWTGQADAMKLAIAYRDVFSADDVRRVLDAVMSLLKQQGPDGSNTHITRPALDFLMAPEAIAAARGDRNLGGRFFAEVLNHSLSQRDEGITTLFNLAAFEKDLDLSPSESVAVSKIVEEVCAQAQATNSSNAADAVRALFAAASQTKVNGVACGANGLVAILNSATTQVSPAFPYAYGPLIDLARERDQISEGAGYTAEEFQAIIDEIGRALTTAWDAIRKKPRRLASFSIPRSDVPNPILLHNWSVATVEFAKLMSDATQLNAMLDAAEAELVLADTIHLARVMASVTEPGGGSLADIGRETSDVFYRALGYRLSQALKVEGEDRLTLMNALISKVMMAGPKDHDLAVFAVALPIAGMLTVSASEVSGYLERLRVERNLYSVIGPLAFAFQKSVNEQDD